MKNIAVIFLLFLIFGNDLFCQELDFPEAPPAIPGREYKWTPRQLIPYFDRGKWGWCDTLGTVVIKPTFKGGAGFFGTNTYGQPDEHWKAFVRTKAGENEYVYGRGLKFPKKFGVLSNAMDIPGTKDELYFITTAKKRIGLYGLNSGIVVKPDYQEYSQEASRVRVFLFRKKREDKFDRLNLATRKVEETNIVDVRRATILENNVERSAVLAIMADSTFSRVSTQGLKQVEKDSIVSIRTRAENGPEFEEMSMDDPYRSGNITFAGKDYPGREEKTTVESISYSRYRSSEKYGFNALEVIAQNGLVGLTNESGEEILPVIYDKITFTDSKTQVHLYRDGKEGRKVLFNNYNAIAAKYDELRPVLSLRVNGNWTFGIFRVSHMDKWLFVGENGVEYFRLK